jgi:hypothetical protein
MAMCGMESCSLSATMRSSCKLWAASTASRACTCSACSRWLSTSTLPSVAANHSVVDLSISSTKAIASLSLVSCIRTRRGYAKSAPVSGVCLFGPSTVSEQPHLRCYTEFVKLGQVVVFGSFQIQRQ